MICSILGYDNDKVADEFVLGFMLAIYPFAINPLTRFKFSKHLTKTLHNQLTEFTISRFCRFQSYLVHMLLHFQVTKFHHLNLNIEDEFGNPISVIHWSSLLRKKPQNVGFPNFIDQFMYMAYALFHEEIPSRFSP
jgi:hypothetical protein